MSFPDPALTFGSMQISATPLVTTICSSGFLILTMPSSPSSSFLKQIYLHIKDHISNIYMIINCKSECKCDGSTPEKVEIVKQQQQHRSSQSNCILLPIWLWPSRSSDISPSRLRVTHFGTFLRQHKHAASMVASESCPPADTWLLGGATRGVLRSTAGYGWTQ